MTAAEVLICAAGTCTRPAQPEHTPCCDSSFHGGRGLCCEHHNRFHYQQVGACSPETHAAPELAVATDVQRHFGRTVVRMPNAAHLTDEVLVRSALQAARKTPETTHGRKVSRGDHGLAVVALYTD